VGLYIPKATTEYERKFVPEIETRVVDPAGL
jgi:hypothetical protein